VLAISRGKHKAVPRTLSCTLDIAITVVIISSGIANERGEREPYIFHFPDGNASIARLLVRSLVPGCAPGNTMEDIVTAKMNYAKLDDPASSVRIRLNSTAIRAVHLGDPATAKEVEVTYVRGGSAHRVRAAQCVLACYNMVIPYLCPEMSETQKEALAYAVKIPLCTPMCRSAIGSPFRN
jgi:spermidine dehydrogenase